MPKPTSANKSQNPEPVTLDKPIRFMASATAVRAYTVKAVDPDAPDLRMLEVLASGTKLDSYDDRMSVNALNDMAEGFPGKDFLPSHRAEWNLVMGEITAAEVKGEELFCTVSLKAMPGEATELANTLWDAVLAGKKIGVSIAGWIKRIMWEDDYEIRVIDSIEPDHICATRTPAYADAFIVGIAKSLDDSGIEGVIRRPVPVESLKSAEIVPAPPAEPAAIPVAEPIPKEAEPAPVVEDVMNAEEFKAAMAEQAQANQELLKSLLTPLTASITDLATKQEAISQNVAGVAARVETIESTPIRKGQATIPDTAESDTSIEDPLAEIIKQSSTQEFEAFSKARPADALRAFVSMYDVSDGNILTDCLRAEGAESGVAVAAGSGWGSRA